MVFKVPSTESHVSEELGEVCGGALPGGPEAEQTGLGLPPPVLPPEQLSSSAEEMRAFIRLRFGKLNRGMLLKVSV